MQKNAVRNILLDFYLADLCHDKTSIILLRVVALSRCLPSSNLAIAARFFCFTATTPGERRSPKPIEEGLTPSVTASIPLVGLEDLTRGDIQEGRVVFRFKRKHVCVSAGVMLPFGEV